LSKFSKLIRKTLDNSRRPEIYLSEEIDFLHLYLELERMRFNNKFSYTINLPEELSNRNIEIPSMILQPFVENAIRHGKIGSLPVPGVLKIDFLLKQNELVCTVEDNGVGIHRSLKLKNSQPGPHETHAMDIMNDRMRTINEFTQSGIRYTIADKADLEPGQSGTLVKMHIPLN
jgi:two-component system LytT family sensor kinase